MKTPRRRIRTYRLAAVGSAILLVLNVYLVQSSEIFGIPQLFSLAIFGEIVLFGTFLYTLFLSFHKTWAALERHSIKRWRKFLESAHVIRFQQSQWPPIVIFNKVLRLDHRVGLPIIRGTIIALVSLTTFSEILEGVLFKESITQIDTRVANLIPTMRTPFQTHLFTVITFLGNTETIIFVGLILAGVLYAQRQRWAAAITLAALVIGEVSLTILKQLVHRVRPELALRLIHEDSFSFPSGHALASTLIYGLLTYFIIKSLKSPLFKLVAGIGYSLTIFFIAVSRVYLDVHYPSDVLASIFFGAFLLTLAITALELHPALQKHPTTPQPIKSRALFFVPPVIIAIAIILAPLVVKTVSVQPVVVSQPLAAIDESTVGQLPHYSETLSGRRMEPISFIYIGSAEQIQQRFAQSGWHQADPATVYNVIRSVAIAYQDKQYLHAPVTPSYLDSEPEQLAFEQPTPENTLRLRHHIRIWQTDYVVNNQRVWVATASFDAGVELAPAAHLPTHRIDPDVDKERAYIIASLGYDTAPLFQVVDPHQGKNASGDSFYTDGRAVRIQL